MEWKAKKIKYQFATATLYLALTGFCWGQTYTFIVYKDKLSADIFKSAGKDTTDMLKTKVLDAANTTYALIEITPKDILEENEIRYQESVGAISILMLDEVKTETIRGVPTTYRDLKILKEKPEDFNTSYEVKKST